MASFLNIDFSNISIDKDAGPALVGSFLFFILLLVSLFFLLLYGGVDLSFVSYSNNSNPIILLILGLLLFAISISGFFISITALFNVKIAAFIFRKDRIHKTFPLDKSMEFYDFICDSYNNNNTNSFSNVHSIIQHFLETYYGSSRDIRVMDLGGGTGLLCSKLKSLNPKWDSYDFSINMVNYFNAEVNADNAHAIHKDIHDLKSLGDIENKIYDVIIMCYTLSSMHRDPDFYSITRFLKDDGIIIIADSHPDYQGNTKYCIRKGRKNIALSIRPIDESLILQIFTNLDFYLIKSQYVTRNLSKYAYVNVFRKEQR